MKYLCESRSGEKIPVVSFNIPLSEMLEEQFKDYSSGVEVKRFKRLVGEITGCNSDQQMEENIKLALTILEEKIPENDHIFVDECQDLIGDKWTVFSKKCRKAVLSHHASTNGSSVTPTSVWDGQMSTAIDTGRPFYKVTSLSV